MQKWVIANGLCRIVEHSSMPCLLSASRMCIVCFAVDVRGLGDLEWMVPGLIRCPQKFLERRNTAPSLNSRAETLTLNATWEQFLPLRCVRARPLEQTRVEAVKIGPSPPRPRSIHGAADLSGLSTCAQQRLGRDDLSRVDLLDGLIEEVS